MRQRLATLVLIGPLALAGCSGESTTASSTASAAATSPQVLQQTAQPQSWERVPAARRAAFMKALKAIDPGLTVNEERALRRGTSTCSDISEGASEKLVVERARLRFTGGNAAVNDTQARRIVAAAKRWICPGA